MNKKTTPSASSEQKKTKNQAPAPQQKTLELLKRMARNYCAAPDMPEGLQGVIIG